MLWCSCPRTDGPPSHMFPMANGRLFNISSSNPEVPGVTLHISFQQETLTLGRGEHHQISF